MKKDKDFIHLFKSMSIMNENQTRYGFSDTSIINGAISISRAIDESNDISESIFKEIESKKMSQKTNFMFQSHNLITNEFFRVNPTFFNKVTTPPSNEKEDDPAEDYKETIPQSDSQRYIKELFYNLGNLSHNIIAPFKDSSEFEKFIVYYLVQHFLDSTSTPIQIKVVFWFIVVYNISSYRSSK